MKHTLLTIACLIGTLALLAPIAKESDWPTMRETVVGGATNYIWGDSAKDKACLAWIDTCSLIEDNTSILVMELDSTTMDSLRAHFADTNLIMLDFMNGKLYLEKNTDSCDNN